MDSPAMLTYVFLLGFHGFWLTAATHHLLDLQASINVSSFVK